MKKWIVWCGLCVVVAAYGGRASAQVAVPIVDPHGQEGSLECQSIEIELGDVSDELDEIDRTIARKQVVLARWKNLFNVCIAHAAFYQNRGEPVPPGVTAMMLWASEAIVRTERAIEDLRRQRMALEERWRQLWMEFMNAGC